MKIAWAVPFALCLLVACDKGRQRAGRPDLIGFIDRPAAGSTVGPAFVVAGWAAGREGVERVRLYLDDEMVGTAPVNIARPDIYREHRRYEGTGPNHGFSLTVDAGTRSGFRTLRVEAVDRRGAKAYVASMNVKIE